MAVRAPSKNQKQRASPSQRVEWVPVASLKPHPVNYRKHPEAQLKHIEAGHGVVLAAQRLKKAKVPVIRLPLAADDLRALKVLTSDEEARRV
jgi:hypothetical protein